MGSMYKVLTNSFFWIGLVQWAALAPLVLVCQHKLIPQATRFFYPILEIFILAVVATTIVLGPLYATGYLPLPSGPALKPYRYGFIFGALLSIPIRQFLKNYFSESN